MWQFWVNRTAKVTRNRPDAEEILNHPRVLFQFERDAVLSACINWIHAKKRRNGGENTDRKPNTFHKNQCIAGEF